jgi:hypothetical protein
MLDSRVGPLVARSPWRSLSVAGALPGPRNPALKVLGTINEPDVVCALLRQERNAARIDQSHFTEIDGYLFMTSPRLLDLPAKLAE